MSISRHRSHQPAKLTAASIATVLLLLLSVVPSLAVAAEAEAERAATTDGSVVSLQAQPDGTLSEPAPPADDSPADPPVADPAPPVADPGPPVVEPPADPPVVDPGPPVADPIPPVVEPPAVTPPEDTTPPEPGPPRESAQNSPATAANLALTSATPAQADAPIVAAAFSPQDSLSTLGQKVAAVAAAAQSQLNPLGLLGKIVAPLYKYGADGFTPQATLAFYGLAGTAGLLGLALVSGAVRPGRIRQLKPVRPLARSSK